MEPDELDQPLDLRLRAAQEQHAPPSSKPAGEHRQVEHQRGVGEHEIAEVDDQVSVSPERTNHRPTAEALSCPVLVSRAPQNGRLVRELDDL